MSFFQKRNSSFAQSPSVMEGETDSSFMPLRERRDSTSSFGSLDA